MKGIRIVCRAGALALLVAASGANAQEEGVAMKSILGAIGIIPKEKPPIIYNERAPLVLPPKMDLRPPASGGPEARNANWPRDPDVAAARRAAQDARTPYTESELRKLSEGRRLSVEEMRASRDPNNFVSTPPRLVGGQAEKSTLTPDELRSFRSEDRKLVGGGLERRYLSDPPAPLLRAAGNAPLRASRDAVPMVNPDSPHAFFRR